MSAVIRVSRIGLLDERLVCLPLPGPVPGFIGPGEAEREIGFSAFQDLIKDPFQKTPPVAEPIMPVTKSLNPMRAGHVRLGLPHLGHPQIIKPQVRRQVGLPMTGKERPRPGDTGPFRESVAPPEIVFRDGVELRQIKGDEPSARFRHKLQLYGASP